MPKCVAQSNIMELCDRTVTPDPGLVNPESFLEASQSAGALVPKLPRKKKKKCQFSSKKGLNLVLLRKKEINVLSNLHVFSDLINIENIATLHLQRK